MPYKFTKIDHQRYEATAEDWMMICHKEHERDKKQNSVIKEANQLKREFHVNVEGKIQSDVGNINRQSNKN